MKYIKEDHVEIKEVKIAGNTFYQVGIDDLLERPQVLKVQEPLKRGPKAKKK